jgi:hypothetical protein
MTPDLAIAALGRTVEVGKGAPDAPPRAAIAARIRQRFSSCGAVLSFAFFTDVSRRSFRERARRDSIHALDALVSAVPFSRWKCISDLKNMGFCNPVGGLPSLAAKRRCDQRYRRRSKQSLIVDRSCGALVACAA